MLIPSPHILIVSPSVCVCIIIGRGSEWNGSWRGLDAVLSLGNFNWLAMIRKMQMEAM